jgi:hypothetical protein
MAGYDQVIKIRAAYLPPAKDFFAFLQAVGRKYARPVRIRYRHLGRGRFYVVVDGGPGGIDALFQELLLNKGLYYYACSLRVSDKKAVIREVIVPIFQQLLEERFPNPYSRFVKKHILGRISQEESIPGEFSDVFSHQYEVLFRKWDIGILGDWDFVKDLDSLLTRFMLVKLAHRPGQRSPTFHTLVQQAYSRGLGMVEEIEDLFNRVHIERTKGLHRLENSVSREELSELAIRVFNYFQYFDEFQESQRTRTEKLHGRRYRRIKYGDEKWVGDDVEGYNWDEITRQPCHDCAAIRGQYHCTGCDVEQCARCRGQRLGCRCKLKKDYD